MSVLHEPCLVLNRNWQSITFLPVQTAITTVMRDMASVLDPRSYTLMTFEEWCLAEPETDRWIKTPSRLVPAPDVIVLKRYGERPPRTVPFNRPNLARRDEWTCQYCGAELADRGLTVEHVVPRSRGGPTSWENCVAACEACNSRKADRTPREAGMNLRTTPGRPRFVPRLSPPRGEPRPVWVPFLEKV